MAVKKRTSVKARKVGRKRIRPGGGLSMLWAIAVIVAAGSAAGIIYNLLSSRGLFRPAPVPKIVEREAAKPLPIPAKPKPVPKPKPAPIATTTEAIQAPPPSPLPEPEPIAPAPQAATAASSATLPEEAAAGETNGCAVLTLEEAHEHFQKGSAIFVDARSAQSFALGHIPRAVNLPASDFEAAFARNEKSLPREARIIIYCQSESCDQAVHVCEQLVLKGYKNLTHYAKGWITWQYSGLPKE